MITAEQIQRGYNIVFISRRLLKRQCRVSFMEILVDGASQQPKMFESFNEMSARLPGKLFIPIEFRPSKKGDKEADLYIIHLPLGVSKDDNGVNDVDEFYEWVNKVTSQVKARLELNDNNATEVEGEDLSATKGKRKSEDVDLTDKNLEFIFAVLANHQVEDFKQAYRAEKARLAALN